MCFHIFFTLFHFLYCTPFNLIETAEITLWHKQKRIQQSVFPLNVSCDCQIVFHKRDKPTVNIQLMVKSLSQQHCLLPFFRQLHISFVWIIQIKYFCDCPHLGQNGNLVVHFTVNRLSEYWRCCILGEKTYLCHWIRNILHHTSRSKPKNEGMYVSKRNFYEV